jgi:oxalate---CoA ligase
VTEEPVLPDTHLATILAHRTFELSARPFLEDIHSGQTLTYARLGELVLQHRVALDAASVAPGGRVLIDVAHPVDFSVAYIGVIAAGRCAVPVNPHAPAAELERHATLTRPEVMISSRAEGARGLALPEIDPWSSSRASSGLPTPSYSGGFAARGAAADVTTPGSVLLLTSGSTGAPKAVALAEGQLLHVAREVAAHHRLTTFDRGFNPLPLFHINAQVVALLASLMAGAELLLAQRFHRHGFWEVLAERDVTWLNLVPAILTVLAEQPVPVRPARLRFIRSASAPLALSVRERIETLVGAPVLESYGMTEAASQITAAPLEGTAPAGSCGLPVGTEFDVRDVRCRSLPPGVVGDIWIRGPGVIGAYDGGRYADRFDAGGWLHTGDRGHVDQDGFVFLAGRTDDVINRGGELLYPREIEEVLVAHPDVRDAVVVARPDAVLGQVPVAYVVPVPSPGRVRGPHALREALSARCAAHLSAFKVPVAICFVEELPRGATGKVQRDALSRGQDVLPLSPSSAVADGTSRRIGSRSRAAIRATRSPARRGRAANTSDQNELAGVARRKGRSKP